MDADRGNLLVLPATRNVNDRLALDHSMDFKVIMCWDWGSTSGESLGGYINLGFTLERKTLYLLAFLSHCYIALSFKLEWATKEIWCQNFPEVHSQFALLT